MDQDLETLIANCDLEPVRFIGTVQEFAALVICDAETLLVNQASLNCTALVGLSPEALLGKKLSELFVLPAQDFPEEAPMSFSSGNWQVSTHKIGKFRYFEFEPKLLSDASASASFAREALDALQTKQNWREFLAEGTKQIQRISGFDRVMVYRYHADDHGEVVAETLNPGVESYFGLHYPASDIPQPARQVFLENWVRIVPKVDYQPVPLVPDLGQATDLGRTLVRSVSPVHLEYLRNMKVGASLTLSIISEGKLWGLIACHHLTPRYIDQNLRAACEIVARFLSTSLRNVERLEEANERAKQRDIHLNIFDRIKLSDDIGQEMTNHPSLLNLIESGGMACSLYVDGEWNQKGEVPSHEQLNELVSWISERHGEKPVFATSQLAAEFPPAEKYANLGAGVMAILIPKTRRNYILLFRPELKQTIRWAGKPFEKNVDARGRLHPRHSFEEWAQSVSGMSAPWRPWDIDAALEMRNAILGIDLRKQFEKEQSARQDAERAMKSREELMAVLSHDLKNPIGSIQLQANLLERRHKIADPKIADSARRIMRAAQSMNSLINDILHITSLEAGMMKIEKLPEDLGEVVAESFDLLSFLANNNSLEMRTKENNESFVVPIDKERLIQVFSNLIGNAIKFTPPGGLIEVGVQKYGPDRVLVSVADTGPGIPQEHLLHVFDRFWQANQAKRLGTGLGLAICKGIVEGHGGQIWAENRASGGTEFKFTLPLG